MSADPELLELATRSLAALRAGDDEFPVSKAEYVLLHTVNHDVFDAAVIEANGGWMPEEFTQPIKVVVTRS